MAGHSKWKNIQHRKGRQDAKRAKIFTKISKEIFASVKSGGADPNTNIRLRMALLKAKEANMPSDNIERTIKKATGDVEGVTYEEITYEGYGPHGVAVMVDVLTDNRNRSAADIRHIFSKNGGNLGEAGCVAYLFNRKGLLTIEKETVQLDEESVLLEALEAGAEDMQTSSTHYELITSPGEFESVKTALEERGVHFSTSEITRLPSTTVELSGEQLQQVIHLMEALEDHDDVQNVFANFTASEEDLESMDVSS